MAKKQHDHGFEMMAIVAIVAVVGLIIMFMNTGNLSGEAYGGKRVVGVESSDGCTNVKCAPDSEHQCCTDEDDQVLTPCETTIYCGSGDHTWPANCETNDQGIDVIGCF